MLRRVTLAALAFLLLVTTVRAADPRFWRLEGTVAFLAGELEGLSLDSEGRLRPGPQARGLFDPEAPNAWCVATADDGTLYLGTGNEGRVYEVRGGEGRLVFDAEQLEVYAVAVAPDGTLYAGTSPDGAVYAIDGDGASRLFFDPDETYVWALAFDDAGRLVVATGGEGRIYRVAPDGTAETLLSSSETHILALALDDEGRVFAGSAPEGILYRVDGPGKAVVLLDSDFREIKALVVHDDGAVWAGVVNGGGQTPPGPEPASPPPAEAAVPVAQVTVTESFAVVAPGGGVAPPVTVSAGAGSETPRGAVLRVDPKGTIETLWRSSEDVPHALAAMDGDVLVGTGDEGKVYRVSADGTWALLASLNGQQVTGLIARAGAPTAVVTSNPARLWSLPRTPAGTGTFVSEVKDAAVVAAWGRLRWEGTAAPGAEVQLATRSGNTAHPDATWGAWTDVGAGSPDASIRSEGARFLQLRLTLGGEGVATPVIEALTAAYLQRNLRPRIDSITVHPPGQVFQKPISVSGEPEILGLDLDLTPEEETTPRTGPTPSVTAFSRPLRKKGLQTLAWSASDPNGDHLTYAVQFRAVGDERWSTLRHELTEPVVAWDTTGVADGRYVVRVTASDAPDNPRDLALAGHEDSASFAVDNAPPLLEALFVRQGARIRATARDTGTPIQRLQCAVDAGSWQEVYPIDGINDSREETYDFALPVAEGSAPHMVVLRVSDRLGNVTTTRVDTP